MNCDEARERMVFHADGEDEEVGLHLRDCPACAADRDAVASERAAIRRAFQAEAASEPRLRPRVRRTRRLFASPARAAWVLPLAAAAAILLVSVAVLRAPRPAPRPAEPPVSATPLPAAEPDEPAPRPVPLPRPEPPRPVPVPETPRPPEPPPREIPKPLPPPPPEPPRDPVRPTVVEERPRLALTLERGTPKSPKWEGARVFLPGETIQAQTALRVGWGTATVLVKEGSTLAVKGIDGLALETGAVVVENAGPPFLVATPHGVLRDVGTRFAVSVAARETETVVYEGRVECKGKEVLPGERAVVHPSGPVAVEPSREAGAYPAWTARAAATASPLVRFPFDRPIPFHVDGKMQDGRLYGEEDANVLNAGVAPAAPLFAVPPRGEFSVTYFTASAEPVVLRCRALLGDQNLFFDYALPKPVSGRPVPVRVPLDRFRSLEGRALAPGDRVVILYVYTRDLKAGLWIDDLSVLELKD
jgi:hypothetical protein